LDWLVRVEAEYLEMPGLQLTEPQMQRLWGLDDRACAAIVRQLVKRNVLRETPKHTYMLASQV
jgi:hypothetical protein